MGRCSWNEVARASARDLLAFSEKGWRSESGSSISPTARGRRATRKGRAGVIPRNGAGLLAPFPGGCSRPLSLSSLLDGIGVESCGDLARLDLVGRSPLRAEGARLALSRADDSRRSSPPSARASTASPTGSITPSRMASASSSSSRAHRNIRASGHRADTAR